MSMLAATRVLVISGSMGSGKTTVLGEASDLLAAKAIPHVAIDLDAISFQLVPEQLARNINVRSLAAIHQHCLDAGVRRFLIAVAIEDARVLADLKTAFGVDETVVCRLTASVETMAARLRIREPGIRQEEFVQRSRQLDATLNQAALEDFTLRNDDRNVTEVAQELLRRAGWT